MELRPGKFIITFCLAVCINFTGLGGLGALGGNVQQTLLAAKENNAETNQQNGSKTKLSSQTTTVKDNSTNQTQKNTGNVPDMPIMPTMPIMPADSAGDSHSSVLNRPWESKEQSIQLKTRWEEKRKSLWDKNNKKVIINIQKKKENIHSKAKGKSSTTEVPVAGKSKETMAEEN